MHFFVPIQFQTSQIARWKKNKFWP